MKQDSEKIYRRLGFALKQADLKISEYDQKRARSFRVEASGQWYSHKKLRLELKDYIEKHPEGFKKFSTVFQLTLNERKFNKILDRYCDSRELESSKKEIAIPKEFQDLTLNLNVKAKSRDDRYFLTTKNEVISVANGALYVDILGLNAVEASKRSRIVSPQYLPRNRSGILDTKESTTGAQIFNTYSPPLWKRCDDKTGINNNLPILFKKLVNHLFPIEEEREFFFHWLHASLFERAQTYLVLCGPPGTGKNRLKLVMRALHGHVNTIDGKKSTLTERFNSQLSDCTLSWFDELKYDLDMENTMKELQNDSISIERKGVDATKSTRIFSSLVISNNKPRDNYIAFDARKFVALKITSKRLEASMTPAEIDELTKKVEKDEDQTFDLKFLYQIAKWVKKNGKSDKWPSHEYRGPMFWTLCHTSMAKWQKKAVDTISNLKPESSSRLIFSKKKGYLWSSIEMVMAVKANGKSGNDFPDYTSVQFFFESFRDGKGEKVFKTRKKKDDILGDFWVKPLKSKIKVISEAEALSEKEIAEEKKKVKKDIIDL